MVGICARRARGINGPGARRAVQLDRKWSGIGLTAMQRPVHASTWPRLLDGVWRREHDRHAPGQHTVGAGARIRTRAAILVEQRELQGDGLRRQHPMLVTSEATHHGYSPTSLRSAANGTFGCLAPVPG